MAQARRWLWGLIPLAVVWLVAIWAKTGPMEADIAGRVDQALKPYVLDTKGLTVAGRDVTLSGPVYEEAGARKSSATPWVADADKVDGVRLVRDDAKQIPEVSPYVFSATREGGKIVLSGSVPRPEIREQVLAGARKLGLPVEDRLTYGRRSPADFSGAAALAISQLDGLADGKVTLTDNAVSIDGKAKSAASRDGILWALKGLPGGFKLGQANIGAPSYDFTASKDPAAGTVTLGGTLPDEPAKQSLLEAARHLFFREKVVDQLKVDPAGAPPGFAAAALATLRQLARLDGGQLAIKGTEVTLSGTSFFPRAMDEIKAALASLGGPFKASSLDLAPVKAGPPVAAPACQALFVDLLGKATILFETGSAKIDRASTALLDTLAGAALRCPSQNFEIGGHTDSTGGDEINLDLSRRRAEAVAVYLAEAGLDRAKLKAVGYGATKPVGANDTEEGKAKNRRIEILVN